ncbi:Retrovirus-related Pol polyprotein from transposon TNT 1-94 [Gossypium australe]|uniref:Retrovirus-related Pol polyprotein from transposon TNT 1-94 n=1 Tax=Gossypium australe TaxID=47621 RepID=A0A5B6WK34_9ROSI|nr:Retrovirus-related Pol polyprotein from transposon TNT 1-94 [Gossypium australe]
MEKRLSPYKRTRLDNLKEGLDLGDTRYKVRLITNGYIRVEGVDFHVVFSLVVKHTSIWVLLALIALNNLELEPLDVKTAFLHGDLEKDIYIQKHEGFRTECKKDHVCLLQKSLYGLKQSLQ